KARRHGARRVRSNAPALVGAGRGVAQMTHANKIAICSARALIFSHLVPFAVLYRGGTVGTRGGATPKDLRAPLLIHGPFDGAQIQQGNLAREPSRNSGAMKCQEEIDRR